MPSRPRISAESSELGEFELVLFEFHAHLPQAAQFSRAELEVLERVAQGASNREIAMARGVSYRTIANQLASMYRKLGVNTREELLFALQSDAVAARAVRPRVEQF